MVILSIAAINSARAFNMFGYGGETCGKWTANETPNAGKDFYSVAQHAWVMGAISEAALFMYRNSNIDILKGTDGDAIQSWITNYCRQYPLDQVQAALEKLIAELWRRTAGSPR